MGSTRPGPSFGLGAGAEAGVTAPAFRLPGARPLGLIGELRLRT